MADVFFDNPPLQRGTAEQQLSVLYGHLAVMADKLNTALHNITAEQLAPEAQSVLQQIPQQKEEREKVRKDLKKLIIKNAEIVETAMEEIRTHLQGQITASTMQENFLKVLGIRRDSRDRISAVVPAGRLMSEA